MNFCSRFRASKTGEEGDLFRDLASQPTHVIIPDVFFDG